MPQSDGGLIEPKLAPSEEKKDLNKVDWDLHQSRSQDSLVWHVTQVLVIVCVSTSHSPKETKGTVKFSSKQTKMKQRKINKTEKNKVILGQYWYIETKLRH